MAIKELDWIDLKAVCTQSLGAAGGLDGWTKAELAWTSDRGFQLLADWYRVVELTGRWPEDQTKTRAVFLSKDCTDVGNPMAYRILKITSTLYRVWGTVRIRNLEAWIRTWADEAMFAGVPGAGSEEGWYITQLDFELKRLMGSHITAGSIDVFKCFDQVVRPLVTSLARAAGMPENILKTYTSFQDDITIHNQIGDALGQAHTHRCSIPQGCPFSMTLIALLMRPWIMLVREVGIQPRVLADDLFLYGTRERHASAAVNGMVLSRQYFRDIGARVADNKCFVTSTCPDTRARLRKIRWDGSGTTLPVVNDFRDLGAHVCMDQTRKTTTTNERLKRAIEVTKTLRWLPCPGKKKKSR